MKPSKRTIQEMKVKRLYRECLEFMGIDPADAPKLKVTHRFNRAYEVRSGKHDLYGAYSSYHHEIEIFVKEFTIRRIFNDEAILETIAHELTHFVQRNRYATSKEFMTEYHYQTDMNGYNDNRFEVEARAEGLRIAVEMTGKQPVKL